MKAYKKISLILGMALTLSACGLIEKVDKEGNPVDPNQPVRAENYDVGKFEGEAITFYDLEREMSPIALALTVKYGAGFLTGDGKELHNQLHHSMMNKIIEDKVLDKKIEGTDIEFDRAAAKVSAQERLDEIKGKLGEYYEGALDGMGFDSEEEYLEKLEKEELRKAFYTAYKSGITVEDKEVEEEYTKNMASYKKMPGAEIYHIYLGVEKEDAEKIGAEIQKKLDEGIAFEEVAKEYGQDGSAKDGGKLGYYSYDTPDLHKDFMDQAKKLKEGEISGVVESTAGFHVIRVLDVTETEKQLTLDEVKEDIRKNLYQNKLSDAYKQDIATWKGEFKFEIFTDKLPKLKEVEIPESTETPTEPAETSVKP